ncbi:MAG TPA: hypothetical protein VL485_08180 [Ktedonobacteraceae bacterium]|nr:hypothetical protein [Ktedonobacteraceae bacterium]
MPGNSHDASGSAGDDGNGGDGDFPLSAFRLMRIRRGLSAPATVAEIQRFWRCAYAHGADRKCKFPGADKPRRYDVLTHIVIQ